MAVVCAQVGQTHIARQAGGLGIFLVRQTMDDVTYAYKDGQNILTIRKRLTEGGAAHGTAD